MRAALALGSALVVGACGADRLAPPRPPYSAPADFPRGACLPGSLAAVGSPSGVWHLDLQLGASIRFPTSLRLDGRNGIFNGRAAEAALSPDDLFVFAAYELGEDAITWSLDACAGTSSTEIAGTNARCVNGAACAVGAFRAFRLRRRPGEGIAQGLTRRAELSLFTFTSSETANVRVRGDLAYLARFEDGLRVVDLSDLDHPAGIGHLAPRRAAEGELYNDVKLLGHYALLASSHEGMVVVDVADPASPRVVTAYPAAGPTRAVVNVHSIFVEGDRAYLAEISTQGLRVVDLADPEHPTTVAAFVHPVTETRPDAYVHDLTVHQGWAYLNYWAAGLVVVDLSTTPPAEIGRYEYPGAASHASAIAEVGGRRYVLNGDEGFGAHLRIVDATAPNDPAWMTKVAEFQTREEVSIHNLLVVGSRAYVAHYQDGVRVLDLSTPSQPRQVAYYNTWDPSRHPGTSFYEGAIGIDVDPGRDRIYVADTQRGLLVLEER